MRRCLWLLASLVAITACRSALEGAPPISSPASLSARGSFNSIEVTWEPVEGALSYYVYSRNPNPEPSETPFVVEVLHPPTNYDVPGGGYGVSRFVSVQARFKNGESDPTPEVEAADFGSRYSPAPRYRFVGQNDGSAFGAAIAAGDLNADGRIDLAVGAPFHDDAMGGVDNGIVFVHPGVPGGLSTSFRFFLTAHSGPGGLLGSSIAVADVAGAPLGAPDGIPDLVAGAPGVNRAIFSTGGFSVSFNFTNARTYDGTSGTQFGACVAVVPYFGEGNRIAIGAPLEGQGRVHVLTDLSGAADTYAPPSAAVAFGAVIAGGDFQNDGIEELVVAAPESNAGDGAVFVFGETATQTFPGTNAGSRFGAAISVGHFSNDPYADIAVGEPFFAGGEGRVALLVSTNGTLVATGGELPTGLGGFGGALSTIPARDSSERDALLAGAPFAVDDVRPHVLYPTCEGENQNCSFYPDNFFPQPPLTAGVQLGAAILSLPDLNGDGWTEMAVGAPGETRGAVYVYYSHPFVTPAVKAGVPQRVPLGTPYSPAGATFEDPFPEGRWVCQWDPDDAAVPAPDLIDPCTPANVANDVSFQYPTPGVRWPQLRVTSVPDGRYGMSRVRVDVE